MAKLNAKQRDLLILELQLSASACKLNMNDPNDHITDMAHKNITDVIYITKVLLNEISVHEFIVGTKDKGLRKYYKELLEGAASASAYKKIGYGPMHGKIGPKKKSV